LAISLTLKKSSSAFDKRIVRVGLEIDGDIVFFQDEDIRVSGEKFMSPTLSQCTVQISNLSREHRNFILTKSSPIISRNGGRNPSFLVVDVGRESYGTFRLFEGRVFTATVTPPPDIGITLRSLMQTAAGSLIGINSHGETAQLRGIAQSIADQNGLNLEFKAEDRMVANYAHSGALRMQMEKLQAVGGVSVFADAQTLFVIGYGEERGTTRFKINKENGMIGVPQATEEGVIVQTLLNPGLLIGGGVTIDSEVNPSVNGDGYNIWRMEFHAANRDYPFFYTLTCRQTIIGT